MEKEQTQCRSKERKGWCKHEGQVTEMLAHIKFAWRSHGFRPKHGSIECNPAPNEWDDCHAHGKDETRTDMEQEEIKVRKVFGSNTVPSEGAVMVQECASPTNAAVVSTCRLENLANFAEPLFSFSARPVKLIIILFFILFFIAVTGGSFNDRLVGLGFRTGLLWTTRLGSHWND